MTTEQPPGVLVQVKNISERCGVCNKPFTMETYLELLTEKRFHRIRCITCNYIVPTGEE